MKKVLTVILSLAMMLTCLTGYTNEVKAMEKGKIGSQLASIASFTNAKGEATIDLSLKNENLTKEMYKDLKTDYFSANKDEAYYADEKETTRSPEGVAFDDNMIRLGLIASATDEEIVYKDQLNLVAIIDIDFVSKENITLKISLKINDLEKMAFTSLTFKKSEVSIDIKEVVNFISSNLNLTKKQVCDIYELPELSSLTVDFIDEISSRILPSPMKISPVKSYELVTDESNYLYGYLNRGKEVVDSTKTQKVELTSGILLSACQNMSPILFDLANNVFSKYETVNGDKTTLAIGEDSMNAIAKDLYTYIGTNASTIVEKIYDEMMKVPEVKKVADDSVEGYIEQLKRYYVYNLQRMIPKETEETKKESEESKDSDEVVLKNFTLSSSVGGETGNRDALLEGNVQLYSNESKLDFDAKYSIKLKENNPVTPAPVVQETPSSETKVGTVVTVGEKAFKITSLTKKTVELSSVKNATQVTIPSTVKIDGQSYKVETLNKSAFKKCSKTKKIVVGKNVKSIGANTFKKCKKLKTLVLNTKKLTKVSKNAFKGVSKKLVIKCPKAQLKKYKKLLKKKSVGYKKTWTIKAI